MENCMETLYLNDLQGHCMIIDSSRLLMVLQVFIITFIYRYIIIKINKTDNISYIRCEILCNF